VYSSVRAFGFTVLLGNFLTARSSRRTGSRELLTDSNFVISSYFIIECLQRRRVATPGVSLLYVLHVLP